MLRSEQVTSPRNPCNVFDKIGAPALSFEPVGVVVRGRYEGVGTEANTERSGCSITPGWGYPFNRSYHMFSAWRILALASTTRARLATSLVSNRCGLPGLPRMAAVARRLRLSELRPRRRLALGRWPLHVSGVFDTQFGDGRYDLRSDADTLDDMVHRLLAVRHR